MPSPKFKEADRLNVVALISGGKDSFFSILHCQANGHRVVALANLYPPGKDEKGEVTAILPGQPVPITPTEDEEDLNSFMYQTVGHQVIPLYADATGLPLYRRAITGGSGGGRDYRAGEDEGDEAESMTVLLRAVMEKHPEVDAVCSGAVLSNYQRTRVESVAIRLGLVPLAYLWQLPLLSITGTTYAAGTDEDVGEIYDSARDDAILLDDLEEAGFDARIIKVASGGLDESFLWTNVASEEGALRVRRAMARFGGAVRGSGAMIGEGGEFETLVIDGPWELFKKRIVIEEKRVVQEGGGSAYLVIQKARLEQKRGREDDSTRTGTMPANPAFQDPGHDFEIRPSVRVPYAHDERNTFCLCEVEELYHKDLPPMWGTGDEETPTSPSGSWLVQGPPKFLQWCVMGGVELGYDIGSQTKSAMTKISRLLQEHSLGPTAILNTVVVLRHMSDFAIVNDDYGKFFTEPNPPSRVCISVGDAMPPKQNIAIYLSVHNALGRNDRQGLHVQSWSYWAPANIGPYSQATSVPIASLTTSEEVRSGADDEARLVQIAGQIELRPKDMTMSRNNGILMTMPAAIQHLWRIGEATKVQWWSSVVAYLPQKGYQDGDEAYAAQTWRTMHIYRPGPDDDEFRPDAWDRRNNPAHMIFTSGEDGSKLLPDIGVLVDDEQYEDDDGEPIPLPAFIAAQVMELPKWATVEFHAHLGFANLKANSVRIVSFQSETLQAHHTCVEVDGKGMFVHTVLTVRSPRDQTSQEKLPLSTVLMEMNQMYSIRISALVGTDAAQSIGEVVPTHFYANTREVDVSTDDIGKAGCPVIPCFNLWTAKANHPLITDEATAVAVYQTMFEPTMA